MNVTAAFDAGDLSPSEAAAAFVELPNALEDRLEGAAEDIGQRIRGEAADNAPVDTGQLASSIEAVVENVGKTLIQIRVGSNLEYAAPQEFGADPHFPPPSALRDWARRVLGDADAAFPVAQSIAATGIEEHRYLRDAMEENIEFAVDRVNEAVTAAFSDVGLL